MSASASASPSVSPSASLSPSASPSPTSALPTTNYDVRLIDAAGYDLLEGLGADRSGTAAEQVPILYASTSVHPVVAAADELRLVIDNHVAASAQIEVSIYIERWGD